MLCAFFRARAHGFAASITALLVIPVGLHDLFALFVVGVAVIPFFLDGKVAPDKITAHAPVRVGVNFQVRHGLRGEIRRLARAEQAEQKFVLRLVVVFGAGDGHTVGVVLGQAKPEVERLKPLGVRLAQFFFGVVPYALNARDKTGIRLAGTRYGSTGYGPL